MVRNILKKLVVQRLVLILISSVLVRVSLDVAVQLVNSLTKQLIVVLAAVTALVRDYQLVHIITSYHL